MGSCLASLWFTIFCDIKDVCVKKPSKTLFHYFFRVPHNSSRNVPICTILWEDGVLIMYVFCNCGQTINNTRSYKLHIVWFLMSLHLS